MADPRNHWGTEYAARDIQHYHEPRFPPHSTEPTRLPPPSSLVPQHAVQTPSPVPYDAWGTHPSGPAAAPAASPYSHPEFEPRLSQRPQILDAGQPPAELPAIATVNTPSEQDRVPPPNPQYQVGVRVIEEPTRYVPASVSTIRAQRCPRSPSPASEESTSVASASTDLTIRGGAMPIPSIVIKDNAQGVKTPKFRLLIRQQPRAARSCGFGDKDRRVIDPPPILELAFECLGATEDDIEQLRNFNSYIVTVAIYDVTGTQDATNMADEYRHQRRLMGSLVSCPFIGKDEHGRTGVFFPFPDLSCRTPGSFRLGFSAMMVQTSGRYQRYPIVAEVMSDVFHVYNAKDFPGMVASSDLAQTLKAQGCILQLKKGNNDRPVRGRGGRYESDDDYDDDDDERMHNSRRKRRSLRG
jgi:hypothetical protein